ncbi:unnamed protein product, partial [Ixodes hexagonus]
KSGEDDDEEASPWWPSSSAGRPDARDMSELGAMQDAQDGALKPGVNVDIRRTDGRVHPAVVTAVRSRLVTVEWFENGQTKGKDVDREALVGLNPALAASPTPQGPQQPSPPLGEHRASGNFIHSAESLKAELWPPSKGTREISSSLPCSAAYTGAGAASKEEPLYESNNTAILTRNEMDLCHELNRELQRAVKMNHAGAHNQVPVVSSPESSSRQQDEAEALAQLLRRYRAVVDVSDLWMTTDVRLLTRLLSTRALEDDAWLRELEDLVLVKMELLAGLRDSVARLRKMREITGTAAARTVDASSLRKR